MHLGGIGTFWGCTSQGVPSDSIWNSMDGCSFWEVKALRVYKPQLSQRFLRLSLRICLQRRGRCISKIKISWMILLMVIYWYFVYTTVYHVICWSEQFVKSTETYQGHKFMVAGSLKSQIVSVMWRLWKVSGSRKKSPKPPKDGEPVSSLADLEPCGSDSLVQWLFWWICILELREFVVCSYSRPFISFYSDLFWHVILGIWWLITGYSRTTQSWEFVVWPAKGSPWRCLQPIGTAGLCLTNDESTKNWQTWGFFLVRYHRSYVVQTPPAPLKSVKSPGFLDWIAACN